MTQLDLTDLEWTNLYNSLTFVLEMLDEDDERYLPTQSVLNKLVD